MSESVPPMSEAMYYILLSLQQPAHGYGMIQRVKALSAGRVVLGPGTLYGVLNRMKKDGWITLTAEDDRRKIYSITALGQAALQVEYQRIRQMVLDGAGLIKEESI